MPPCASKRNRSNRDHSPGRPIPPAPTNDIKEESFKELQVPKGPGEMEISSVETGNASTCSHNQYNNPQSAFLPSRSNTAHLQGRRQSQGQHSIVSTGQVAPQNPIPGHGQHPPDNIDEHNNKTQPAVSIYQFDDHDQALGIAEKSPGEDGGPTAGSDTDDEDTFDLFRSLVYHDLVLYPESQVSFVSLNLDNHNMVDMERHNDGSDLSPFAAQGQSRSSVQCNPFTLAPNYPSDAISSQAQAYDSQSLASQHDSVGAATTPSRRGSVDSLQRNEGPIQISFKVFGRGIVKVERILQEHWNSLLWLGHDSGYRESLVRRFVRHITDVEVHTVVFDKSLYLPSVLPTACRISQDTRYHIGSQWIKEANFVFTGEIHQSRAKDERKLFRSFLSHMELDGEPTGATFVRRVCIPGFSRAAEDYVKIIEDWTNLEVLSLGVSPDDFGNLEAKAWATKCGLDVLISHLTSLKKLNLFLAPMYKPTVQPTKTFVPPLAPTLPSQMSTPPPVLRGAIQQWFKLLAGHLYNGITNDRTEIFLDSQVDWDADLKARLVRLDRPGGL